MFELMAMSGLLIPFLFFLLLLAVLWVLVPFAIFGTKPILRELLEETRSVRRLLEQARGGSETHVACPACKEPVSKYAKRCRFCLQSLQPAPPPPEPEPKRSLVSRLTGRS